MERVYDIADYFLSKSEPGTIRTITHLKLQKLVYYAQAFFLAIFDKPLFDEHIEAWDHGPVSPDLYDLYKDFYYYELPHNEEPPVLPEEVRVVLDKVWSTFACYDGKVLEQFTHEEKPWQEARQFAIERKRRNAVIDHNSMREYFRGVLLRGVS